jgi:putative ABC transport system ATP-binding protein
VEVSLLYRRIAGGERRRRVGAALERVGIAHRAKHLPHQLSGGQQQRVAIARALVADPKLILADEPTGNLDTENGNAVMTLLTQINEAGTTVVMVTHSLVHAGYAKRTVKLLDGRVVSETLLAA